MTTASSCSNRFVQCFLELFGKPFIYSFPIWQSPGAKKSPHCAFNATSLSKIIRLGLVFLVTKRLAAFEIPHLSGFWSVPDVPP